MRNPAATQLTAFIAGVMFLGAAVGPLATPAYAVVTVQRGTDFATPDAKRWLFFHAQEGEQVRIRVRAPGGRPTVTIYRDHFPGGMVVAFGSDTQGTGVAEVTFAAPRTTKYTVRVESGGQQGFTFSYLASAATQVAQSTPALAVAKSAPLPISPPPVAASPTGPRIALVVGVGSYGTLGDLLNPPNDAQLVATALKEDGFDVDLVVNADQRTLRQAISRLGERMAAAGSGATGLFFFAGHGVQSRGVNYLIPSQASIAREADLVLEAVPADAVLAQMQEAGVSTNIMILDACRNTPFARAFRSGTRGLAQMDAPNGSFIAYSTAPGAVAADGAGADSPFATALARELTRPGQPIEAVFRNVRRAVLQDTQGLQTPWDSSSLVEPFYFKGE